MKECTNTFPIMALVKKSKQKEKSEKYFLLNNHNKQVEVQYTLYRQFSLKN